MATRVALTATPGTNESLTAALEAAGFDVTACPLVSVEPLPGGPIVLDRYAWLVLTSRNAVEPLLGRAVGDLPRVAAIGAGTAAALREAGIEPDLVARRSTQEGLVKELPKPVGRVLFAGAVGARDFLAHTLLADFVPLYRTVELRPERFPDADLVLLASPSAARSYANLGGALPCVTMGPTTTAEAEREGLRVAAEAETQDGDGVVEAVKLAASSTGSSPS